MKKVTKNIGFHSNFEFLSLLIICCFLCSCEFSDKAKLPVQCRFTSAPDLKSLAVGFVSPPDDTRAWVYWYVMDGNLTRVGITADLEAMKHVGIGIHYQRMQTWWELSKGWPQFLSLLSNDGQ